MSYLCARGSYSPAGHFDVKSTFGVLLPPQAGVIWRFPRPIPVTDSLSNGLKNTIDKENSVIEVLWVFRSPTKAMRLRIKDKQDFVVILLVHERSDSQRT